MKNDLNHQYSLLTALLNEIEYINSSVNQDITVKEIEKFVEIRFKTNLTQLLFPKPGDKEISLNMKLEESDFKNIEDYFVKLSAIQPSFQEFICNYLIKTRINLSKHEIDQWLKLIATKRSEVINFISQIYTLKKEEIYDKLKSLQDFENTLDRTRKAYITNTDLKKLKEFENINTENKLNYTSHIAYLTISEQGMKQVTESCFDLALLAVVGK